MKISLKRMYFILSTLIINQHMFCMEPQALTTFIDFSQLPAEIQKSIVYDAFKHSDNKNDFRLVSKEWSTNYSIQSETLFNNNGNKDCCGLSPQHMTRIVLCAAYNKNPKGVENILKNSNILDLVENRFPYFFIDAHIDNNDAIKPYGLHLHRIADYHQDDTLKALLNTYQVPQPKPEEEMVCEPNNLLMDCLAGNSEEIENYQDEAKFYVNVEKALKATIHCDHGKCITMLFKYPASNDFFTNMCDNKLLLKLSKENRLKVLEALLKFRHFNLNEVHADFDPTKGFNRLTLLDQMSLAPEPNGEAIILLRKYGAQTKKELDEEDREKKLKKMEEETKKESKKNNSNKGQKCLIQ